MAYAQQARYGPPNDYYDGPRSAPLEPPQEYTQDNYGYGPPAHQQDHGYSDEYGGGDPRAHQAQHRGQPPLRQDPRQHQPPPQNMGRGPLGQQDGGYGNYKDGFIAKNGWKQRLEHQSNQQSAPYGHNGGRRHLQDYGAQSRHQGHQRTAYGQQNYGNGYQESQKDPYYNQQESSQRRPAPQRSYSAGAGQPQASHPDGNAKPDPQLNPAATPKKKGKERILQEPESPEVLAWDNPFPSFPGIQEKKQATKADSSRSQTAASGRRSNELNRSPERDPHLNSNQYHGLAGSKQHLGPSYQPGQPMPPIDENISRPVPAPQHRTNGDYTNRVAQQVNGYQDPRAMMMSPPQPQFASRDQRSNTLPNEVSESMMQGNLPVRPQGSDQRSASNPHPQNPQAAQSSFPPQQRPPPQKHQRSSSFDTTSTHNQATAYSNQVGQNSFGLRPDGFSRKPSGSSQPTNGYSPQQNQPRSNAPSASQGYKQASARSQPPTNHGHEVPQANNGNKANPYYSKQEAGSFKSYRSPPTLASAVVEDEGGDEDMPNFDAALSSPANDKALHIEPQKQNTNTSHDQGDSRGRPSGRGRGDDFAGQAHRSRSQPNLRNQNPPSDLNGFDFGVENQQPEMPQMDTKYAQQRPNQPYGRSPPNPQYQGEWQQSNNGPFGPPPRSQTEGFGLGPGPRSRNGSGPQPYMNSNGVYPGPVPGSAIRDSPGPGGMGRHPPRNRQPPPNISRQESESSQGPGNQNPTPSNDPSPLSSPPTNPDALPHHPAPSRPGHTQQAQSPPINQNNASRPPPVRQYNASSPSAQPNIAPPPAQPRLAAVTYEELQQLRGAVQSRPNDQATQMVLVKKLVEAASTLADDGGRADAKTKAKNRERYTNEAYKMLKKLVGIGNAEAMFFLADCYGSGQLGLLKDSKEAFSLYQSAAKLNHAQSAYRVAVCCEIGMDEGGGTRRDPVKAIQWYQRAATLGDVPAMYKMGVVQLKGLLGQSRNPREAVNWLQKAAERADEENPHALHELALLYHNTAPNDGIPRDDNYACQLFTQAADLGYKFSQFKLGQAYEQGQLGFSQNPRMSIMWYSKAAMQEEHSSELGLSGWYLTGAEGVLQQNDTEAYLWARKAAQAGLAKAEYAMGYFTEVGIGAPADLEAAKRWYWKAASQNFPKARERLEDLRKGGKRIQKTRVSRSAINKGEGECKVM